MTNKANENTDYYIIPIGGENFSNDHFSTSIFNKTHRETRFHKFLKNIGRTLSEQNNNDMSQARKNGERYELLNQFLAGESAFEIKNIIGTEEMDYLTKSFFTDPEMHSATLEQVIKNAGLAENLEQEPKVSQDLDRKNKMN